MSNEIANVEPVIDAELVDEAPKPREVVLVTCGEYDEREVVAVFDDAKAAQDWADWYNATVPWRNEADKAVIDSVGRRISFNPARGQY